MYYVFEWTIPYTVWWATRNNAKTENATSNECKYEHRYNKRR